ncbi:hypothetical protein J6G99_00835 [bacterium]|nr:hypothetical protein [bacterium]
MLNDTIDNAMVRAQKFERHNRTVRFSSNVFKNMARDNSVEVEIMKRKLSEYIKQQEPEVQSDEISEYIKEDPDSISVDVKINSEPMGLPFFRSIRAKLQQVYGY